MAPKEMDQDDIRTVIRLHVEAAKRSLDAGFDICEIHGAHGYIVQQFLSPITNKRTDAYGGDIEGRMRFGLELVEAVRAAWPADRPLFFRGSCVDGRGGIWGIEDTIVLARQLKERGVDVFDCSSGGIDGPLTLHVVPRVPGYHVPFARRIRAEVGIRTMAVGLITQATQAETYLEAEDCDLVALAREMLWNPNWPIHAAKELGLEKPHELLPPHYAWWLQKREETFEVSAKASHDQSVA
jgi:2,4-dienoyl-CoA reductase-like NADH-dependent reductase (Old Yellow Enzyme family)